MTAPLVYGSIFANNNIFAVLLDPSQIIPGILIEIIGPVGQSVQNQSAKTGSEFRDLANARQTPDTPAATGQPLTRKHTLG